MAVVTEKIGLRLLDIDLSNSDDFQIHEELVEARKRFDAPSGKYVKDEFDFTSCRIGCMITWLPRKLCRAIRSLKKHGLRRTWNQVKTALKWR